MNLFTRYCYDNSFLNSDEIQLAQLYHILLNILKRTKNIVNETFNVEINENYFPLINVFNIKSFEEDENKKEEAKYNYIKTWIDDNERKELFAFYIFYKKISTQIEVKFQYNEDSDRFINRFIYFFKHPRSFTISKTIKSEFLENVDRSNLGSKIDNFNKNYDKLLFAIDICYFYRKNNSFFAILEYKNQLF